VILAGAGLAVGAEETSEEPGPGAGGEVVEGGSSGAVFEGDGVGSEDEEVGGGGGGGWEGDGDGGLSTLPVVIRIKCSRDDQEGASLVCGIIEHHQTDDRDDKGVLYVVQIVHSKDLMVKGDIRRLVSRLNSRSARRLAVKQERAGRILSH
jgi:hypothetical protein